MVLNSFSYVTEENQIPALVDALFETTGDGEKSCENSEMEGNERLLATSLILYLFHFVPNKDRTFENVAKLVELMEKCDATEPYSRSAVDVLMEELEEKDETNKAVVWYRLFKNAANDMFYPVVCKCQGLFSLREKHGIMVT